MSVNSIMSKQVIVVLQQNTTKPNHRYPVIHIQKIIKYEIAKSQNELFVFIYNIK